MHDRRHMVLLLLVSLALACDPFSGTDREKSRQERIAAQGDDVWPGERNRREAVLLKQEFAERFRGRIAPGVGCEVCPAMCRSVDLRAVPDATWQQLYRRAARQHGSPRDDRSYQLAALELHRLACIARDRDTQLRTAWLALLDRAEDPAVRCFAAIQLAEHGVAPDAARRALTELAAGSTRFQDLADLRLEEWALGIVPSL